ELGSLEPVGGLEGLGGEVAPAVTTAEPLDTVRGGPPGEEPGPLPAPVGAASPVVGTSFVGTEGRNESSLGVHAEARLHSSRHLQSSEHDPLLACRAASRDPRSPMPQINRGFTLTWLGHNTFKLRTRGAKTVLLDPWVEGNPATPRDAKAFDAIDVMTISHGHGDHMSDAVTLAKK